MLPAVPSLLLTLLAQAWTDDTFLSELHKLKGDSLEDLGSFDNQELETEQGDKRVKRFPQFTHFGSASSPHAPAPAYHEPEPYHPPAPAYHQPEPHNPPAPAYHQPETYNPPAPAYHQPEPYNPPAPAYHQPEPYNPPAPAYHQPEPYNPPAPVYHQPEPYNPPAPAYHQPEPYNPPAPAYHQPETYNPPAPAYHQPEPYHPPALEYHESEPYQPTTPTYHEPKPYHPPAHSYHEPEPYHDDHHHEEHNEHGVVGHACVDYPCHAQPPYTKFTCADVPHKPGMYADPESGCQAYRVCNDGRDGPRGAGFLCPNGTLFDQYQFACEYWNKVDCSQAPSLYSLNADPAHNPYYPKPKLDEYGHPLPVHHAAPHHAVHHAEPLHHPAPIHPVEVAHPSSPLQHPVSPLPGSLSAASHGFSPFVHRGKK